jgi:hypothetical protein
MKTSWLVTNHDHSFDLGHAKLKKRGPWKLCTQIEHGHTDKTI